MVYCFTQCVLIIKNFYPSLFIANNSIIILPKNPNRVKSTCHNINNFYEHDWI